MGIVRKIILMLVGGLLGSVLIIFPAGAEDKALMELDQRIQRLENKARDSRDEQKWTDRIAISGLIEGEAGFSSPDFDDPETESKDASDIALATVELGIDAEIHEHISGHLLLLWEEDNTDPLDMDEGYITLDGKKRMPLFLKMGKIYLPFGYFESRMVSDPVTLELGETNQSAVQLGYTNNWAKASIAIYNGDVDEGDEENAINGYAAAVQISLDEGPMGPVSLSAGVSYISNLADSGTLTDEVTAQEGTIESHVAGMGAFIDVAYNKMFFLTVEYISALKEFEADDLNITGGNKIEPSALNLEFAYVPMEQLEVAVRYAQTVDIVGGIETGGAFPESQYGITATYTLFENTTMALEYLKNDYENNDELSVITTQLAIEF